MTFSILFNLFFFWCYFYISTNNKLWFLKCSLNRQQTLSGVRTCVYLNILKCLLVKLKYCIEKEKEKKKKSSNWSNRLQPTCIN